MRLKQYTQKFINTQTKALVLFMMLSCDCLILNAQLQLKDEALNNKPNIIYILADDLGYGDLSCMNERSKLKTEHIDALAEQGMRFTDAHSNSSVCTPSRYGILTGRYAWRTRLKSGVTWSYDSALINPGRTTVASLLNKNGYNTACIGKWHLGMNWGKDSSGNIDLFQPIQKGPTSVGFDYFFGIAASANIPPFVYVKNNRITATSLDTIKTDPNELYNGFIGNDFIPLSVLPRLTDSAVSYIHQQALLKQPFFLYYALPSPHTPIVPSQKFIGKSETNLYGDFVLMTDHEVGRIVEAVKQAGIAENTLIVFTSDNGCSPAANYKELAFYGHNPSYRYRGTKFDIFEGGHRVPFIVKWPGKIKPGSICAEPISLTDFLATCAAIQQSTLENDAGEDSYSMLPLLLEKNKEIYRREALVHHSFEGYFAIRKGQWKLAFCRGSGSGGYPSEKVAKELKMPPVQLYNLRTDPSETNNVAYKHPVLVREMTALMKKYIGDGRSTPGKKQKNSTQIVLMK